MPFFTKTGYIFLLFMSKMILSPTFFYSFDTYMIPYLVDKCKSFLKKIYAGKFWRPEYFHFRKHIYYKEK